MKKTTITLFSISTILAVLIIAMAILLIGNYTKNLNSGINLEPQVIQTSFRSSNNTDTDKVWVLSNPSDIDKNIFPDLDATILSNQIVLGIVSQEKPTGGYKLKLNSIKLRGQRININYQISSTGEDYVTMATTYPRGLFTIAKEKLPVGVPLEFVFYNQTTKTEIIINKTITL